jgi:hypothetical protein
MKFVIQFILVLCLIVGCSQKVAYVDGTNSEVERLENLYPRGILFAPSENQRFIVFLKIKEIEDDTYAHRALKQVEKNYQDKIFGVYIYEIFEDIKVSSGTARCLKYDHVFVDNENRVVASFRQHGTC